MEMQQIRYFLALARTLNFTRAAEECNVSQSALTRAIKALEGEFGGELIRREHSGSHLTELGKRMMPLMQRCYDSAASAKALAQSIARDDLAPLSVSISNSVNAELVMAPIAELFGAFSGLQLKLLRGGGADVFDALKRGDSDLAIAGPLDEDWGRLDHWTLFEERFDLVVGKDHPLARENQVTLEKLNGQPMVCLFGCESRQAVFDELASRGMQPGFLHESGTQQDLAALVETGIGVAFAPQSMVMRPGMRRVSVSDFLFVRKVSVHAVAGRKRESTANALLNLLRSSIFALDSADAA